MAISWLHQFALSDLRRYIPSPIRSSLRRFGTTVGLLDEHALTIGLDTLYETDTFISSYPKSGNTWVRFLIANMHHPSRTITFRNLEEHVPMMKRSPDIVAEMNPPRFMKTHMPHFTHFPRCIYIYRDVRDVAISYYHFAQQHGWHDGTLSDFVRDEWPWTDIWLSWDQHVIQAIEEAERRPDNFLVLQYETMLEQPLAEARRLANFCDLDLTDAELQTAVKDSSFDNLQSIEDEYGHETEDDDVTFFRKGDRRQWESELDTSDQEILLERFGDTLEQLGYQT